MAGGFREFLEELFAPLDGTTIRSMFGGHGVFRDGVMFGLLDDDVLYLRVDESTQPRFEAEKSRPFVYEGMGRPVTMPYWQVPERLLEDAEAFLEWAKASFAAAHRAKAAKQPKGRTAAKQPKGRSAARQPKGKAAKQAGKLDTKSRARAKPAAKTKSARPRKAARRAKTTRKNPARRK